MEEKVAFKWEILESEFKEFVEVNRPDLGNVEQFWTNHGEEIVYRFEKGFASSWLWLGVDALINDAIDAVVPPRVDGNEAS